MTFELAPREVTRERMTCQLTGRRPARLHASVHPGALTSGDAAPSTTVDGRAARDQSLDHRSVAGLRRPEQRGFVVPVREIWIPAGVKTRLDDVAHALTHCPQETGLLDMNLLCAFGSAPLEISARAALRDFALQAWINGVSPAGVYAHCPSTVRTSTFTSAARSAPIFLRLFARAASNSARLSALSALSMRALSAARFAACSARIRLRGTLQRTPRLASPSLTCWASESEIVWQPSGSSRSWSCSAAVTSVDRAPASRIAIRAWVSPNEDSSSQFWRSVFPNTASAGDSPKPATSSIP